LELNLKEGISSVREITVTENQLASKVGSGHIEVFATPSMIALMEETSYNCVQGFIPNGYTTVGIEVNIKHVKATSLGNRVKCESILKKVDGKKLTFKVDAWDEEAKIGTGMHKRYVVKIDEFMKIATEYKKR